jgi:hypothetical protein
MSCSAHEAEIDKDALQRLLDARVLSFSGLRCPFCGDADLFVHAPGTGHWSGTRTWWTIGCDSRKCNSCWTLNEDTYEGAMVKIRHAQNNEPGSGHPETEN